MPNPITFPDQREGEQIKVFFRKYWISFLPTIIFCFFLLLIPLITFLVLRFTNLGVSDFKNLLLLGFSSYILVVLAFFLTTFIDYYLDVGIITDQRIVDIAQNGLFHRTVSEQDLIRIQDVKVKKQGIFQTFFDFGDVFIQTAGEAPNFNFSSIPKPNEAAQVILAMHHEIMASGYREPGERTPEVSTEPSDKISEEELKKGGEIEIRKPE